MSKPEQPHCKYCDSTDVKLDAFASWDTETQQWVLAVTYDNGFCSACERDAKSFNWKEIPQ